MVVSAAKRGQLHNALVKLSREVEEAQGSDGAEADGTDEATDRYILELSAVQER
jgi:hypothetical protein